MGWSEGWRESGVTQWGGMRVGERMESLSGVE